MRVRNRTQTGLPLGCCLLLFLTNFILGGAATKYTVEFWVQFFRGELVEVPFLVAAIVGLFAGQFFVPAAVITWMLSFVL